MSIEHIAWVLNHSTAKGNERLVLLGLANHADPDGFAWPSVARLAQYANRSERTVQYALRQLEETGHIVIAIQAGRPNSRSDRRTNLYKIVAHDGVSSVTPREDYGVQTAAPRDGHGVQTAAPYGVQTVAPESSVEPSVLQNLSHAGADAPACAEVEGETPPDEHPFWQAHPKLLASLRTFDPPAALLDPELVEWCRRITDGTGVFWDDQMRLYTAWLTTKPPSRRHKNLHRGFKAWVQEAIRRDQWRETSRARTR